MHQTLKRLVAHRLEPGRLGRHQIRVGHILAVTYHDLAGVGLDPHDVERPAHGQLQSVPLADREVFDAIMVTEHASVPGDNLSRAGAAKPVADEPRMLA